MDLAASSRAVVVDVVSDIVCPWCFIGKRKLERALTGLRGSSPDVDVSTRWHPFQLNPDLPREGVGRADYLAAKFGGTARADEIYARVNQAGREVGIDFDFERILRQPNTLDAHRLVAWAQQRGDAEVLVERLFSAYFLEGRFVGDREELARIAGEAALSTDEARVFLASDELREQVANEDREARDVGVQGVPFFIFNGKTAVSGAHEPATLLEAIAAARNEA